MFDDQVPAAQGGVPPNLPMGEPEDMFGSVDPVADDAPAPVTSPSAPENPTMPEQPPIQETQMAQSADTVGMPQVDTELPSAVTAGKLQPKMAPAEETGIPLMTPPPVGAMADMAVAGEGSMTTMPPELAPQTPFDSAVDSTGSMGMHDMTSPNIMKTILTVVIILVVAITLGAGGWYLVTSILGGDATPVPEANIEVVDIEEEEDVATNEPDPIVDTTDDTTLSPEEAPAAIPLPTDEISAGDIADNQILFGDDIDTDEDELSDAKEEEFGTDPRNWDTDGDGLGDGVEVLSWGSDPLDPDTDGDGFEDGAEVNSGYSPVAGGGARLFEAPQAATTTTTATSTAS